MLLAGIRHLNFEALLARRVPILVRNSSAGNFMDSNYSVGLVNNNTLKSSSITGLFEFHTNDYFVIWTAAQPGQ
jgi:hypothetical protein